MGMVHLFIAQATMHTYIIHIWVSEMCDRKHLFKLLFLNDKNIYYVERLPH